jgi:hypothetical protein
MILRDEGGIIVPLFANEVLARTDKVNHGELSSLTVVISLKDGGLFDLRKQTVSRSFRFFLPGETRDGETWEGNLGQ